MELKCQFHSSGGYIFIAASPMSSSALTDYMEPVEDPQPAAVTPVFWEELWPASDTLDSWVLPPMV